MVEFLPLTFLPRLLDTIAPFLDVCSPSLPSPSPHLVVCIQSTDSTLQKKSYKVLQQILSSENDTHKAFVQDHLPRLISLLSDSLSTSSTGSKKV